MRMQDPESYFTLFDRFFEENNYPLVHSYYKNLKEQFYTLTKSISYENVLLTIKELVIIDAKLQIIMSLINDNIFNLPEWEIIKLSEIDSSSYYKELLDMVGTSSKYPSILFL